MIDSLSNVHVETIIPVNGFGMLGKYGQCCWTAVSPHRFKVPLYTDILKPRPELQQHVDEFTRLFGTSYGALHARIEGDIRNFLAKSSREHLLIGLAEILGVMNNSTLRKVDTLSVDGDR